MGWVTGSRKIPLSILFKRPRPGGCIDDGTTPFEKLILPKFDELRRSVRIPFEQLQTKLEFGGESHRVQIANLSQEGVRLVVDANVTIETNQEVLIGVGAINPNVKGRVRWVSPSAEDPTKVELGVEFESFLFTQPVEEDVRLPWWGDFRISDAMSAPEARMAFSVSFSMSPVKKIECSLKSARRTIDMLLVFFGSDPSMSFGGQITSSTSPSPKSMSFPGSGRRTGILCAASSERSAVYRG